MDSKKVLEKLLKIAANQQKIILKLAQALPPDALPSGNTTFGDGVETPTTSQLPPQQLEPDKTVKVPQKVFYDAMSPQQKAMLVGGPEVHGNNMQIKFKPGQATQANYNSLLQLLQDLTNQNKIQQAFNLKYVA